MRLQSHECARAHRQPRTPPTSACALGPVGRRFRVPRWVLTCTHVGVYALMDPHAHICIEKRGCMHAPANACHGYMPTYTYSCIYIYIDAYSWPRRIEQPPSASAPHRAPAAEGGAYPEKRRHRRGVPRADVRAERRRPAECLQAEPHAVHADGKCSKVRANTRACACACVRTPLRRNTQTRTPTLTNARAT
jgi:hypothetical protein